MRKIITLSFILSVCSVFAQQNIAPQNLFVLSPAERAIFPPPAFYFPLQWTGYEGPSLKGFWEAFNGDTLPVPLNPSQDPGGWYKLDGTGSQNHSILWIGESVIAHALAGNVAQYEIAAKNAIKLLDSLDFVQGHMRHEAFGLYIGFWEGGVAAMALGGFYAPAGSTSGPALLKAARRWWSDHVAMLRRVRMPDGQIIRLGARMNHGGPGLPDDENLSCALNLQLIDPLPYNVLHPMLQARITADGQAIKGPGSKNPVQWNEPRASAERWVVLRAVQSGAILRVPADHSTPFMLEDVYKWTVGNKTYAATPQVTGYPNCRWKSSWTAGQYVNIEIADTGNTNGGKGPHLPPNWQPGLNIPANTPKILGPVLTTPDPACAAGGTCTNDAAVVSIVKPYHNGCMTTINPQVVIKNEGTNAITNLALYYQIDNYTLYSQLGKGATKSKRFAVTSGPGLLPDSTITLTLDASTVTPGTHTLKVWVMDVNKIADKNATNDLQSIQFTVVNTGKPTTYSENFESITPGDLPADWTTYDGDDHADWFVYSTGTNKAAAFNNYAYTGATNERDELVMPVVDLTGNSALWLSFDLSHASRPNAVTHDSLEVLISADCGQTFTSIWGRGGAALNTVADNSTLFIPAGPQDYQNIQIDLSAYTSNNKAIIKFVNWSNNGNSTLIDNVNFTVNAPTSVKDGNNGLSVNVFPNPATETVQIGCQLQNAGTLTMRIVNSLGQTVAESDHGLQPMGFHLSKLDVRNYPAGIYNLLIFSGNEQVVMKKIVVSK